MKLNCNHLSLGAPGTAHIKWESAGGMIARHLQTHIHKIGSHFYKKSSPSISPSLRFSAAGQHPASSNSHLASSHHLARRSSS
jgi:hypothetical protein